MNLTARDGVHKALYVRMFNTLHGFNCLTDDAELILGILHWPKDDDNMMTKSIFGDEPTYDACNEMIRAMFSSDLPHLLTTTPHLHTCRYVSGSYGGTLLLIPISIRHHADVLIKFIREMGFHIKLQTKLNPWYAATNVNHDTFVKLKPQYRLGPVNWQPFSKETSEQIALFSFEADKKMLGNLSKQEIFNAVVLKDKAWLLGDERLWCTPEGKAFATTVKQHYPNEVDDRTPIVLCDKPLISLPSCPYDFPLINSSPPPAPPPPPSSTTIVTTAVKATSTEAAAATAATIKLVKPTVVDEKNKDHKSDEKRDPEEKRLCVICLGREASTLVEPCGHCVVCSRCSEDLQHSNDAKICVQCRNPITFVTSFQ
jgi:hypothetical protein